MSLCLVDDKTAAVSCAAVPLGRGIHLEVDTRPQEHVARWIRACGLRESTVLQVGVDAGIVNTVKNVEGIDAKLQVDAFRDGSNFL